MPSDNDAMGLKIFDIDPKKENFAYKQRGMEAIPSIPEDVITVSSEKLLNAVQYGFKSTIGLQFAPNAFYNPTPRNIEDLHAKAGEYPPGFLIEHPAFDEDIDIDTSSLPDFKEDPFFGAQPIDISKFKKP